MFAQFKKCITYLNEQRNGPFEIDGVFLNCWWENIKIITFKFILQSRGTSPNSVYLYTAGEMPDVPSFSFFFLFFFFKKMEKRNLKQGIVTQKRHTRFHKTNKNYVHEMFP